MCFLFSLNLTKFFSNSERSSNILQSGTKKNRTQFNFKARQYLPNFYLKLAVYIFYSVFNESQENSNLHDWKNFNLLRTELVF